MKELIVLDVTMPAPAVAKQARRLWRAVHEGMHKLPNCSVSDAVFLFENKGLAAE
ncbi:MULTISPECIES: hypothetical protein [Rhizobium]|uniref:hypothetical protein n=1 Tax=Rhizobium TaxID=379 RepID=UPI0013F1703D|nr:MULTISPECIES: hypothetical protein [Rhizobium]MBY4589959.1 hypothetical protein [Rhizobium redzepovicii]MBY4614217.1 hypothetical protein [Rhizobium redzepovicii]ULJ80847.1 hypothetical protein MF410_11860 [Rhizobium sp. C104]